MLYAFTSFYGKNYALPYIIHASLSYVFTFRRFTITYETLIILPQSVNVFCKLDQNTSRTCIESTQQHHTFIFIIKIPNPNLTLSCACTC